jgi:putative ABC transport system permease protein
LSLVNDTRTAVAQVDATQPIFDVMTLRQVLNEKTISLRYIATVMGAFAGLAVLLAVLGLYAVMTFLVARRVREIGVRIALGATSHDVVRLTLGSGGAAHRRRHCRRLRDGRRPGAADGGGLLGIVSSDIRISAVLAAGLGATALFSSYLPARRAASVDPIVALRAE